MASEVLRTTIAPIIYILSTMFFVFGLKRLTKVRTARQGNMISGTGMLLAVIGALLELGIADYRWIAGGLVVGTAIGATFAVRVAMTGMPELVALLNGFGGAASALVGLSVVWSRVVEPGAIGTLAETLDSADAVTIALSVLIGAVTLMGSLVALLKLQGRLKKGKPILLPARHALTGVVVLGVLALGAAQGFLVTGSDLVAVTAGLAAASSLLGILLVIPIGGADMPVVVSLLNSYSGLAAAMAGFVVGNPLLIVAGATVGAAGIILTQIMCVAMNRSLLNVLVGGFGVEEAGGAGGAKAEYTNVRSTGAEEAALMLESAASTIFIPGYGLAVAQAQHIVRELADEITRRGGQVKYAIHPVAGRMPGHMNVLLAEADVPYEQLVEMDLINPDFKNTDVVIVVGANDVVNPAAAKDPSSPIFGMPILNAHEARTVFVIKRSLGSGYAGIKNELFELPNTMMLFGDAKQMLQDILKELKTL